MDHRSIKTEPVEIENKNDGSSISESHKEGTVIGDVFTGNGDFSDQSQDVDIEG
jgi:hypothetical protein